MINSKTPTPSEIKDLVIATLKGVCDDGAAPAAAKAGAARTLAEIAGMIGRNSQGDSIQNKSLNDMTVAELDAVIAGASRSKPTPRVSKPLK